MTNILESVRVQIYERLSSPIFGSFVISWACWNYRFLLVLLLSRSPVEKRFDFIDAHLYTSWGEPWNTCVIKPALTAILFVLLYPRVSKFFYREWLQKQVETKELRDKIEKATLLTREESHAIQMRMIKLRDEYEETIKSQADEIETLKRSQKTDTSIEDSIKTQVSETAALKAEITELTNRVKETQQSNPLFLNVIRFITDDHKATGFKSLIEHTVGLVDRSVAIIIRERTFKDFIDRTGYKLLVSDELNFKEFVAGSKNEVLYASSFGVPDMNNPGATTMAHYIICKDQTIRMNSAALSYYDWAYHLLKMETGMVTDTEHDQDSLRVIKAIDAATRAQTILQQCVSIMKDATAFQAGLVSLQEMQKSWNISQQQVSVVVNDKLVLHARPELIGQPMGRHLFVDQRSGEWLYPKMKDGEPGTATAQIVGFGERLTAIAYAQIAEYRCLVIAEVHYYP